MTTRQPNRAGRPWQRKSDGRWCARAYPPDGSKPKMVYGKDEAEVLERQHEIEAEHAPLTPEDAALIEGSTPAQVRVREMLKPNPYLDADRRNAQPPKPVRITVDLDPVRYRQLHELATAAVDVKSVSLAAMVRAMIDVASLDNGIRAVVVDMARRGGS